MLWFLAWMVFSGKGQRIELHLLTPGHTRKFVNGRFMIVERPQRRTEAMVPADGTCVIEERSTTATCVPSVHVEWSDRKSFLTVFGTVPSSSRIQRYYFFTFERSQPVMVQAKTQCSSSESR